MAVLCGPRRAELARLATGSLGADVLLLDDGFQHRALARDLDVVVLDAGNPFGNGHLLPRGPNREPRQALCRAGLVWLSRVEGASPEQLEALRALAREATGHDPVESRHQPVGAARRPAGRGGRAWRRCAAAGCGSCPASPGRAPSAGRSRRWGRRWWPRAGSATTTASARPSCRRCWGRRGGADLGGVDWVVTTEKDAVRLGSEEAAHPRLRVLRIEAQVVRGEEVLGRALDAALARFGPR